jgi:segregation and condensation protein A
MNVETELDENAEGEVPSSETGPEAPTAEPVADVELGGIADGVRTRDTYSVALDAFEGPLDLLLHLVRRHELDILDIPIAFVARKYIEYIEFARALDIEVAGEYLVMAATLAFLKSRELLPRDDEDELEEGEEEGVDPRQELIQRLLEYERYRHAGSQLDERPVSGRDVFARGGELDIEPLAADLAPMTLFRLANAYQRVLDRARISQSHDVEIEPVTVRQRMKQLTFMLGARRTLDFEGLFLEREWHSEPELRQMLVVTLMSVLELVKLGVLAVHQPESSETILLERVGEPRDYEALIEGYDEAASYGDATTLPNEATGNEQ